MRFSPALAELWCAPITTVTRFLHRLLRLFLDFAHRLSIEDLATRDNVINVPVALPTGYVINRPSQNAGDRVDANKDGPNKEVGRTIFTTIFRWLRFQRFHANGVFLKCYRIPDISRFQMRYKVI